jgi:uncharacterized membrane protein YfhO
VETENPTVVVIAQSYHPNWRATVDGQLTELLKANHAFQAIRVSAGRHRVVLRYRDRMFQAGCVVSLMALVVVGFARLKFKG